MAAVPDPEAASQPCYSMRLVRPFITVLQALPGFPREILAPLDAMDPDERIPIATVHELLEGGLAMTGDPDLGLRAALAVTEGDHGALEYAARSSATVGDAVEVIGRFMRLVNDALDFRLELVGDQAQIHLYSRIVLPRAAADYQSAAFQIAQRRYNPIDFEPEFEVLFSHPAPAGLALYEQAFAPGKLRFSAPFNGFVFDRSYLQMPMPTADHKLHALMQKHAELLLAELPKAESVTEKVRALVAEQLSGGNPSVEHLAEVLHMSPRTLGRKLEHEGTTFKELLDDLRRRMALRYVGGHDLGLSEIAFLLGFSQTAAFHRAFKRWTGQTPIDYRRSRRG
jgi:AraC-like DNA-binding protein